MKKSLFSLVSAVALLAALASCLGDNDYTYYDDAAITSFSLGTLNRYNTVLTSSGEDSIVKSTLSCAGYVFYIDQTNGTIWNSDSLPLDVDASKVVCTITSKNAGTILYKSLTSDSLTYYSASDSIDFTQPRQFYVYSSTGANYRTYDVLVNVHQEEADTCIWTRMTDASSDMAALTNMRGLSNGTNIYLFGSDESNTKLYYTPINDNLAWSEITTSPSLSADAARNTIMKGETFFTLSNGQLLRSDDAHDWDFVAESNMKMLLGASTTRLYALSADAREILRSDDDGISWTTETLDDDGSFLPTEDISFICHAMPTNANTDKIVLIGNRNVDDYPNDTTAVVWTKVDEYSSNARSNSWLYMPFAADNYDGRAPRADNWQAVIYDENNIKAICGNGKKGSSAVAFDRVYHSGDDGITWMSDSIMSLPEDLSSSTTNFAFVADKVDSVWLICGDTGQVWKGHINRVAWKKDQDYFIE